MSCLQKSLRSWNTFSINAHASKIVVVDSVDLLCQTWQNSYRQNEPVLLLGEGSNVLFLEDFAGKVIVNRIRGIDIKEDKDAWLLHVGAGENWHQLVELTLDKGMPGLENLALIPGCAGSAPIQNIGAYGVELKQVCEYVDVVKLAEGTKIRLSAEECQFGYRDSIFKHRYSEGYAIVALGLRLIKNWQPELSYGELKNFDAQTVSARQIFDAVCDMRRNKLPDPHVTGNAGSFFKNPLVDAKKAAELKERYPAMPVYMQTNGEVKLAAGWLIEQCDLKGARYGGAAVHENQALVLINRNNASGSDIAALAKIVRQTVAKRFDIWLEPEVRFIAANGETSAVEAIA